MEAVRETAQGLYGCGAIAQVTMQEFDRICLPPVPPLSPEPTQPLRE
jgi:putative transcriptional regulator